MPDVKAILLVGGMGTRLSSALPSKPKVLAPIGQRPFLELVVRQLRLQGICDLVMCTGYLAEHIESTCGDGHIWDVSIKYSWEDEPLGTAGAVKLAQSHLCDAPEFLVLNGDSFLEINFHDLIAFHRSHADAVATMAIVRVEDAGRYGTVSVDAGDRITKFAEKTKSHLPGLVNGGVYVFGQTVWREIPNGYASLEREVLPRLLARGVYAKQCHGLFIDIGTPTDYARAQSLLQSL